MIRAVGRALAIFDAFDNEHLSLSLQEIAERIQMPKTTAFRFVNTLERAGFLIRMDNQRYCLSLKLARLGGLVRSTLGIRDIARPIMLQVNELTQETVTLNAVVGNDRMVIEVVDTPSPLMSMARPGERMPLLLSASARILMAHMKPEQLEKVLAANIKSPEFDRSGLERELARFRRQGYGLSRGQRVPGLTAIAVPIFDIHDEVPYCLSITGPSVRIDARDHELAEILISAGRDISNRLGASPEHALDLKLLTDGEIAHDKRLAAVQKAVPRAVHKTPQKAVQKAASAAPPSKRRERQPA